MLDCKYYVAFTFENTILQKESQLIGTAIKELRERQGIGLNQLAKQAGIAPSVLSYIENENRDPRFSTLCKLAKALRVSVSYFEKHV